MTIWQWVYALSADMALAAIPAVGFAMVFNVPVRALKYCALAGAIGHGCRFVLMHQAMPIEWASFFAAMLVGMTGILWSRRLVAPPHVFTVAAVIPMVPGVYAFKTMIALVEINQQGYSQALWQSMVANGITAVFTIAALAIGLAMPGLMFYRRRPVI
ncbi:threonine/serine exporter family protein [Photobacterium sp. R1]